ncbi:hypothetical protein FGO68_gene4363 [Halteria grandinella]|uniref:Uncharacterized protein n=1 Tax=Halteria grandinella TaxID=5974 RepID=A0A8J8NG70_HALGN|nr:hypothetical protein FGO68_gene4363 [Halteria grandinella]
MFNINKFAKNLANILAEKSEQENDEYLTMKEDSSQYPVSTFSFKADNHPIDKKRVKTQSKSEIPKSECQSKILKHNLNPDSQYSFFKQEMKPEELHYEGNSVLWNLNYLSFNLPRRQSQFQLPQVPRFCVNEKSWYQEFKEIKE